jgi:ATP-binding cassette, subfamily B, bacterial PglK
MRGNVPAWQAQLGVVSQSVFLVDGTLRENIALGVADEDIDDERVAEAVRLAQLEDFVAELPDGLETRVGERGVCLSGGQRQRVAIARALYRRPSVIVFDEGTSALDNDTEAELVEALEQLRGERTIIMVAHLLTTVRPCDRILVVEDGRISDSGTFEELAGRNRLFATFAPR